MLRDNSYSLVSPEWWCQQTHIQAKLLSPGLMVSKRPEGKLRWEKEDRLHGVCEREMD